MLKKINREVTIKLKYFSGIDDPQKGIYEGGVCEPEHLDELIIDIENEEIFDMDSDSFIQSGNKNLHISGSRRALKEFGTYLIALSNYKTNDPDYHDHFDAVSNSNGKDLVNMIVHLKK